jgi:hypothetical protein
MANINSFAENINNLIRISNNQIELLNGMYDAVITDSDTAVFTVTDDKNKSQTRTVPSWASIRNKISGIEEAYKNLLKEHQLTPIATAPKKIQGLANPTQFNIDPNWWFEDLMYPSSYVSVDLKGKIDDSSDRVLVNRVILDYRETASLNFYNNTIVVQKPTYENLIKWLNDENIVYTEDLETLDLPLNNVSYQGEFKITDIKSKDGYNWYTVDTLEYRAISRSNYTFVNNTIKLKKGDKLSCNKVLYEITDIEEGKNKIKLSCIVGTDFPTNTSTLSFFNEPWSSKEVNVKFSNNEINIVYFKGINEDFNLSGVDWSEPIMFVSNDLIYSGDLSTDYNKFYANNIVDWGRQMIDDVRERKISATRGVKPNAPVLDSNDYSVVQINTQVNASLDTAEIIQMKSDIETTKSRLTSMRSALASLQTEIQSITDPTELSQKKKRINEEINEIASLSISYRTSLDAIKSILKENDAIDVRPKYHIRGFFNIPEPLQGQQVIGFQIMYRYKKPDATGVDLKTYTYTGQDNAERIGVYSDWNRIDTPVLEKEYDPETGKFKWVQGNTSKGDEININQVDIPITKGEVVEFKVRSISEAGYPYSPLKSDWSNSVTISFPANLLVSSDIDNLIKDINDENVAITVESIMSSKGVESHLSDSIANANSASGLYFKHEAKNIAVDVKSSEGSIKTVSLQDVIDILRSRNNYLFDSLF